jgi:molybdenum cofactor cytidylyltransferase
VGEKRSAKDVTALVLAAGRSQRMGRPKMTLPLGASTVIGQVVASLAQAGLERILVVTGADRQGVEQALSRLPSGPVVETVYNPAFAAGEMLSSLQAGLRALGATCQAALVALGDQPQIQPEVARAVLAAYTAGMAPLVVPSYRLRRGHPWIVDRLLWKALFALQPDHSPRHFLAEYHQSIEYVVVDTNSILMDIDTPEDYAGLSSEQSLV